MKKNMMRKKNKNRRGFTLVELVVVVGILAILAIGALMGIGNISSQARAAAENADGQAICRALNTYNALAATPMTSVPAITGLAELSTDATKASDPDLITMSLGVTVPAERYKAIVTDGDRIKYTSEAGFTYTPKAK